jgi:hypothetical protein
MFMKKIIIAILLLAILVVCGVLLLKGKTPIPGQNSIQTNKLQGAVNVCEAIPKEKISQFLGKEINRTEVATNKINPEPSCFYYIGTKTVYLELNRKSDINEQLNGWKILGFTVQEEPQIPLKNFVVCTKEGKVRRIYLIIDKKTFLTVDNWGLGLTKEEELGFVSKLSGYLKSEFGAKL